MGTGQITTRLLARPFALLKRNKQIIHKHTYILLGVHQIHTGKEKFYCNKYTVKPMMYTSLLAIKYFFGDFPVYR